MTTPVVADTARAVPQPSTEPWPEPWRSLPGARPQNDYWDVARACWTCDGERPAGRVPAPRRGD
jgi:hypothetical protein